MYNLGWVTGTGGGISIKLDDEIYIAPSGVQKERIQIDDMFIQNMDGEDLVVPPGELDVVQLVCYKFKFQSFRIQKAEEVSMHTSIHGGVSRAQRWRMHTHTFTQCGYGNFALARKGISNHASGNDKSKKEFHHSSHGFDLKFILGNLRLRACSFFAIRRRAGRAYNRKHAV
jgi:hypothetical protein